MLDIVEPSYIFPSTILEITSTKNSCSLSNTLAANISGVSFSITATLVCAAIFPLFMFIKEFYEEDTKIWQYIEPECGQIAVRLKHYQGY